MSELEKLKQKAAWKAVEYVRSGMVLGLGTGSTTRYALERIASLLETGKLEGIVGVPSSLQTEQLAQSLGIPLTSLDVHPEIDLTIDGADEVDTQLNLIKGGGGALLREKVLAQASREFIVIVDESKLSPRLGTKWALPIEVIPFAKVPVQRFLESLGATVSHRLTREGKPFRTDENNYILDARFGEIEVPEELAARLNTRAGIVEHGLFLSLANRVIVAKKEAVVEMTPETTV